MDQNEISRDYFATSSSESIVNPGRINVNVGLTVPEMRPKAWSNPPLFLPLIAPYQGASSFLHPLWLSLFRNSPTSQSFSDHGIVRIYCPRRGGRRRLLRYRWGRRPTTSFDAFVDRWCFDIFGRRCETSPKFVDWLRASFSSGKIEIRT